MFKIGEKLVSASPLQGGCQELVNCVRGEVVKLQGDEVTLRKVQIYLPGAGWYPSIPIEEGLTIDTMTVEMSRIDSDF
jgi:hypothetical protein